jgi:DNA polymerase-3 subunit alpha
LRNAKAIGCFYVESPAMRMLLTKLQVDDYLGLVAASSVIRPGVSSSGMMKEFIHRHRDPKARERAHPQLLAIMPETYGVMVYQEDVIKVGHYFGGLTLAEADVLRRGMSGKFRGREEFERTKASFFEKAISKGNEFNDVAEIWRQIESFAGYVDFFLLQDLVSPNYELNYFLTPTKDVFESSPLPESEEEYLQYMQSSTSFTVKRNERIKQWSS